METIIEFFSKYWLYITLIGVPLSILIPFLFVWRHKYKRKWLLKNGQPAQAKILKFQLNGITINTSGGEHSDIRGISLLLEVYPPQGQPYQIKTRDQLHMVDLSHITPNMMVKVHIQPNNPKRLVIIW